MANKADYEAKRVYNGTWGFLYIDGYKIAEVTAFNASVELETEDVNQVGSLAVGKKPTGHKCEGSIKTKKISPYMRNKLNEYIKKGQIPTAVIVAGISDPDATQGERICIKDASFTQLTLMDWEAGSLGEEEHPFTFTDWEVLE